MIKEEIDKIVKEQINKGLIHPNDGAKKEGFEMGLLYALNQGQTLIMGSVCKSFTYKDISKVAEELANKYSSDKKDPVWIDIRQDGIKAIQAFISKHL